MKRFSEFIHRKLFVLVCLIEHGLRNGFILRLDRVKNSEEILQSSLRNFKKVKHDNKVQTEIIELPHSDIWNPFFSRIEKMICKFKCTQEALNYAQTKIMYDHRSIIQPTVVRMFIHYDRILRKEFSNYQLEYESLCESKFSDRKSLFKFNNKLVSGIFFWHAYIYLSVISKFKKNAELSTICEIGSGYGALARLFLLSDRFKFKRYILIDTEESLYFAEIYLKQNFKHINFSYIHDKFDENAKVIFCPVSKLAHLRGIKVNLVLNVGSLQEMSEPWVSYYMNWIDSIGAEYFFSCNYFGQSINQLAESQNYFSSDLPSNWSLTYARQNPTLLWFQTSNRDWGELFFERDITVEKNKKLTKAIKGQQDFLLKFFEIKHSNDAMLIWDFVQTAKEDLNFTPKELLFLLNKISSDPTIGKKAIEMIEELNRNIIRTNYSEVEMTYGGDKLS